MRCPECHSLNEEAAAACSTCGLILLKRVQARRSDDLASQRRRASDESAECPFCEGTISGRAIRCKHCSEIVNDEFYRDRAQRIRSRVNYTSWIAYIFGLGALMVFRPVGLLSIATGLLLSIAYYAIPVDPPASRKQPRRSGLVTLIRKQFKLERVSIPIPAMRNKKLVFVGTPLVAAIVGYAANLLVLQEPMNDILKRNSAFNGMEVSAHYQYWVVPGVVVYDLRSLGVRQTPLDVHKAFLEFARTMKDKRYSRVELSYQGVSRFSIDGASFRQIGEEYAKKNFDFVLYRLPRLFQPEDGARAPEPGIPDRDALLEFHKQWYGNDALSESVAGR